jgi:hypothetical protein
MSITGLTGVGVLGRAYPADQRQPAIAVDRHGRWAGPHLQRRVEQRPVLGVLRGGNFGIVTSLTFRPTI